LIRLIESLLAVERIDNQTVAAADEQRLINHFLLVNRLVLIRPVNL
jgi:hypothetical protein